MDILFGVLVVFFLIWIYMKFIARKCPECKSFDYKQKSKKLINKYKEKRQSTTGYHTSSGSYYEEYWNYGDYVFVYEAKFLCKNCNHEWIGEIVEKKDIPRKLVKKVRIR